MANGLLLSGWAAGSSPLSVPILQLGLPCPKKYSYQTGLYHPVSGKVLVTLFFLLMGGNLKVFSKTKTVCLCMQEKKTQ